MSATATEISSIVSKAASSIKEPVVPPDLILPEHLSPREKQQAYFGAIALIKAKQAYLKAKVNCNHSACSGSLN